MQMSQSCKYKRGDRVAVYANGKRSKGTVTKVFPDSAEMRVKLDGVKKSEWHFMKACRKLKKKIRLDLYDVAGYWAPASEAVGRVTVFIPHKAHPYLHYARGEMIFRRAKI